MPTLTQRFVADIESLGDLPSLSPVLAQLIATLGRDDASLTEVAGIIRQDPVLAARVMRSANSAAHARRTPVASIREALLRLGLVRVRRLALVVSLYDAVPVRGTHAAREAFWRHSLAVAHGAEIIARHAATTRDDIDPEECFLAGLLHDIGLLVLESHYPEEAAAVKRHADTNAIPLCQAELAMLSADHGELGSLLAAHWSMPESIAVSIRFHHRIAQAVSGYEWHAAVVHLSDVLVSGEGPDDLNEGSASVFDESVFEILGLDRDGLSHIMRETGAEASRPASVLSAR